MPQQKKEGSSEPIAVRWENLVTSLNASNRSYLNGDGAPQVSFDIIWSVHFQNILAMSGIYSNANMAFQTDEGSSSSKSIVYSMNDPTLWKNTVCVDPTADKAREMTCKYPDSVEHGCSYFCEQSESTVVPCITTNPDGFVLASSGFENNTQSYKYRV